MNQDREIRLRDLLLFLLSKWKLLIIAIIIGALAGVLCTGFFAKESDSTVTADDLDSYDITAINLYFRYLALANDQLDFIKNAELMQLDPYDCSASSISYYVKCSDASTLGGVLEAYTEVLREMNSEYGDLLSYNVSKDSEGYVTDTTSETQTEAQMFGMSGNGIIRITLYGKDADSAQEKAEAVGARLVNSEGTISDVVAKNTIEPIGSYSGKVNTSTILSKQKSASDTLYSMTNNMNNVKKTFSSKASTFAEKLIDSGRIKDYSSFELDKYYNDKKEETKEKGFFERYGTRTIAKMAAMGAVIALAVLIVILILYYALSRKLRVEDCQMGLYGVPCFGIINDPNKKRLGIDKKIRAALHRYVDTFEEDAAADIMAAKIRLCAEREKTTSVYATGSVFMRKEEQFAEKMKKILEEKGIKLIVGRKIFSDALTIDEMGAAGSVILIEEEGLSTRTEIEKNITYCKEQSIKPFGIIIMGN